ncbi:MAG: 23S rRNA (adenine(2503)-C(2))-methyltransferase RlmN [Simkania sp.]|nr:23S rRNA (adenine(2503)-C(2))-methyltransferase RlmN [Simkania sp.]
MHAARLYTEWFKQGDFGSLTWVEPQALSLVQEIIENVECAFPQEAIVKQAGSTSKFLLAVEGGWQTESVLIPMESSTTICISSQVGCRMGCAFCETGRMGLLRHLKAEEIIAQVVHARYVLKTEIRNIVFMGMGEPLDNYDEVMLAVKVLTDPSGLQFGTSRITISTSGKVDAIYRMMEEMSPALNLAVSVNAPNDAIRQKLMPVNRKWNMTALKEAMIAYCAHPRREILIEYVLISGVNAELQHADVLAEYLKGLRVRVNLIPYNPQSLDRFSPPKSEEIEAFMCRMKGHGYQTLLRHTKGQGIMAACGQLGNMSLRAKLRGLPISTKESMNPPEKKSLSVIE